MAERIIFMGSPDFAVPILKGLSAKFDIVSVITQPDKPAGRGRSLMLSPVKTLAQSLGISILQPEKLRNPETFEAISKLQPDLIVLAAYGKILRQEMLDLPKKGCINVHASLLPRWRGASPVQAAIAAGDLQTGVTIMKMDAGMDTGPILAQESIPIEKKDNSNVLLQKLSIVGSNLLLNILPRFFDEKISPYSQPVDGVTYAPMLTKEDGLLDFSLPAKELERKIRAYYPWPGCYFIHDDLSLKISLADVAEEINLPPGKPGIKNGYPVIGTAQGALVLLRIQPAGKKAMDGRAFLLGMRTWIHNTL
jgi:methionyl-tRNA formyltransferase